MAAVRLLWNGTWLMACLVLACISSSRAASINLFENSVYVNVNGVVTKSPEVLSLFFDSSLFDFQQGLGTFSLEVSSVGANYVSLFVDHDIDEAANTFFNELGSTSGTPAPGQTWEIDEPGFQGGDIFDNFNAGTLDNSVGFVFPGGDDVSMALAWNFELSADERAKISFVLSETAPASGSAIGFRLAQNDPDSAVTIYFSSTLEITSVGVLVPDAGATAPMLGLGLCALAAFFRTRKQSGHH